MSPELRPYQQCLLEQIANATDKRILIVCPTGVAVERGYKPGWVAHKYREKFGDWPQHRSVTPIKPTPEVLSWVRSRNIAFAKATAR